MKILNIHNIHAHPGGTEVFFDALTRLLRGRGHEVVTLARDNTDLQGLFAKLSAFGAMIYSKSVYQEIRQLCEREKPAAAFVHNLYPQFSVSALDALRDAKVPVLMYVHDYKLTCPTAQHLRNGEICEKCLGGREYYAALHNCRGSRAMSTAFAIRNAWARRSGSIEKSVTRYICPTQFVADQIGKGNYPKDRMRVIPHFVDLPDAPMREGVGEYFAFVGRVSPEKGVDTLIESARATGLPVKIAGDPAQFPGVTETAPKNVEFVGKLNRDQLQVFLSNVRALIVPSAWFEVFGLVVIEALSRGIPVIASRIGGLPEVVQDGQTGLLVEPRNVTQLSEAMQRLWNSPDLAREYGQRGYDHVRREHSVETYYQRLTALFTEAGVQS